MQYLFRTACTSAVAREAAAARGAGVTGCCACGTAAASQIAPTAATTTCRLVVPRPMRLQANEMNPNCTAIYSRNPLVWKPLPGFFDLPDRVRSRRAVESHPFQREPPSPPNTPSTRLHSLSLARNVEPIGRQSFGRLHQAAWPAYLQLIDLRRLREAKVGAHVIVREIAAAAAHFGDLFPAAGFHLQTRADRITVALRPLEANRHPVVAGRR